MSQAVFRIFQVLVWLFFAAAVVQFFLAGLGAFETVAGIRADAPDDEAFGMHAILGLLLVPTALLILIVGLVSALTRGLSWGRFGMAAGLFALMFVQLMLGGAAQDVSPYLAALHGLNALLLLIVSYTLARGRHLSQITEGAPQAAPSRVR